MWSLLLAKIGGLKIIAAVLILIMAAGLWFCIKKISSQAAEIKMKNSINEELRGAVALRDKQAEASQMREEELRMEKEAREKEFAQARLEFTAQVRELKTQNDALKKQIIQSDTDLDQLAAALAQAVSPDEKVRLLDLINQKEREINELEEQIRGIDCLDARVPDDFIDRLQR